MKKHIFIILFYSLLAVPSWTLAQDSFIRTQRFNHQEWRNPAVTGLHAQKLLGLSYRQYFNQTGVGLGTYELGFSMPINNNYNPKTDNSSFTLSSPKLQSELANSDVSRRKHGLGVNVRSLKFEDYQKSEIQLSYAYHLPILKDYNLSFGTHFIYGISGLNTTNLSVRDPNADELYQDIINRNGINTSELKTNIGLAFYSKDLLFSVNTGNLPIYRNGFIGNSENTTLKFSPQFSMSYKWTLPQNLYLIPTVVFQPSEFQSANLSLNLRLNYNNLLYVGVGLADISQISGLIGLKIAKDIFLNYSFDTYSNYGSSANGVHEITITYLIKNKRGMIPLLW